MLHRQGFTLMEMIVVLIIIAIAAVFSFPNFTTPTEQARAMNAWNNLLAIYSAEKNYNNNNGGFALGASGAGDAHSLAAIDSTLSLNIQDDGTYTYDCGKTTPNVCTATRTSGGLTITVKLLVPIQLTGASLNPACNPSTSTWCP